MRLLQSTTLPYCGAPPVPSSVLHRWNLDPVLLASLAAIAALYLVLCRRTKTLSLRQSALFYSGWLLSALALVSPLCPLSVSLFSARVGQHMILTLIGAPLIAAGLPRPDARNSSRSGYSAMGAALVCLTRPASLSASIIFAVFLWLWHTPLFYDLTFTSSVIYWVMHITLFGSALYLWWQLLASEGNSTLRNTGAATFASIQMGLLGAIITFAPQAVYSPHQLTTFAWSLTPLQDQQLGGVIMWVPGCLVFLLVTMYSMARLLASSSKLAWNWAERTR